MILWKSGKGNISFVNFVAKLKDKDVWVTTVQYLIFDRFPIPPEFSLPLTEFMSQTL
jgi:hypothetical protein